MVLWAEPEPVAGSTHSYNYRLVLVAHGICVMRYDNEAGKGDHANSGDRQAPYRFTRVDRLVEDFLRNVERWLDGHADP